METNVVIKIYDSANSLEFEIPISTDELQPLSIDKKLSDLQSLTDRSGVKSSSFRFPITKDIAEKYDFFNSSTHNNNKDVDSDKVATIESGGVEIERGKIRLIDYSNDSTFESVEAVFYGNNTDWTEGVKSKTLADLIWENNSIVYNPQTIKSSWSNTVDNGDEWVFPLESRGANKVGSAAHTEDFRLALFFKSILTSTLKSVGYTLESSFMNTANFKKLVITHFGKRFRKTKDVTSVNKFQINSVGKHRFFRPTPSIVNFQTPLNISQTSINSFSWDESTFPSNDNSNLFDASLGFGSIGLTAGRFTAATNGRYRFSINCNMTFSGVPVPVPSLDYGRFFHGCNVVTYDTAGVMVGQVSSNPFFGNCTEPESLKDVNIVNKETEGVIDIYLAQGESAEFWFGVTSGIDIFSSFNYILEDVIINMEMLDHIAELDFFDVSDIVDDQVKVLDLINDVSRLFNLIWDTDTVLKKVYVEPRNDFYNPIREAKEITDKIDVSRTYKTAFNSSNFSRNITFKYVNDSSDVYVSELNKLSSYQLSEYVHKLPLKFIDGTKIVSTKVLATTHYLSDKSVVSEVDPRNAPYTSRYWKEYTETPPSVKLEDHRPRLLNFQYTSQLGRSFRFYDELIDRNIIPSVLPHKIVEEGVLIVDTGFNLYWNSREGQKGLFLSNWSKTITELINGRPVELYMVIDPLEWNNFDFRDVKYIDEPVDLKGYWVVEKIENYQPENSMVTKVKLLKRVNYDEQVESTTPGDPIAQDGTLQAISLGTNNPTSSNVPSGLKIMVQVDNGNGTTTITEMLTSNSNGTVSTLKL